MGKWLKTGRDLGAWLRGFAIETAVFGAATKVMTRQIEEMRRAMASSRESEELRRQLKAVKGGAAEASRTLKELYQISKNGKFGIAELVKAELAIDVLSKGALGGGRNLRQLAAIAQDTGKPIDGLAASVGDLYGALAEGRPVGEAADELAAFGAITPNVAKQVDTLQRSGAGMAATWNVVEKSLADAESRAASATKTLADLEAQRANVEGARDTQIGNQFLAGQKASERAAATLTQATAGAAVDAIRPLAALFNGVMTAKEAVVNFVTSWKGLGPAVTAVSQIFQAVLIVVLLSTAKGMIQIIGVVGRAAISLTGLGRSAAAAAVMFRGMSLAMRLVVGVAGALITAVTFAGIKYLEAKQRADDFENSLTQQRDAARDAAKSLMEQAAAIQTLRQRTAAQLEVMNKLQDAELKWAQAKAASDAAQRNGSDEQKNQTAEGEIRARLEVEQIRDIYKEIAGIKASSLAPDQEALDLAMERYKIEKQIRQEADDAIVGRQSVDRKPAAIRKQIAETSAKIDRAQQFQDTFRSDENSFDPLRRELDLAKQGKDKDRIAKAQAAVDAFRNDPARNPNFTLSREIEEREAARAGLDRTKSQIAQNPLRSTALKQQLAQQEEEVRKRFGSVEAVSPAAISDLNEQRRRNSVDNEVNPLLQRRGQLNSELPDAERAAKLAKDETDLAAARIQSEHEVLASKEKGYDLAVKEANARKAAIGTEIAQLQKRIGDPHFNDAETRNSIGALVNEASSIDKSIGNDREVGLRTKKGAEVEVKARQLEAGGNDEAAAIRRDAVRIEERILQLREEGLTKEEATKQARSEQRQDRIDRNRARNNQDTGGDPTIAEDFIAPGVRFARGKQRELQGQISAIQVDSMTGVGGNSGGGALTGSSGLLQNISRQIAAIERAIQASLRTSSTVKWDDNQRGARQQF